MIESLFSFRGRMGRLAYAGWTFATVGILFFFVFAALLSGAAAIPSLGRQNAPLFVLFLFGLLAVVMFWSSLALSVKRIRDTGFSPLVVIGVAWSIMVVSAFIPMDVIDAKSIWPFGRQTPISAITELAFVLFLVFWPSDAVYQSPDVEPAETPESKPLVSPPEQPPKPRPALTSPIGPPGARREFGLRRR
jgi:uncharacterized membrane protein YhaH (DUF805 family)